MKTGEDALEVILTYLQPGELLTLALVSKRWSILSNIPALWPTFISIPVLASQRPNPRLSYIRCILRQRYIFALDGIKLLRIDLSTRASTVDRMLSYHPDLLRLSDGSVFFCGGWSQKGTRTRLKSDVWIYDPMTKGVETMVELGEEKTAVALVEQAGMVYAFGGARKGVYLRSANRYLLDSHEKEILPSLPWEMRSLTATQYAGHIYLCHTPNLEVGRYNPTTSVYEHLLKAADRIFAQVLLSVQRGHLWTLILSKHSQVVNLAQSQLSDLRITAKTSPKKYLSPVQEYAQGLYFLGRTEQSIAVWQVRVHGNGSMVLVLEGPVA